MMNEGTRKKRREQIKRDLAKNCRFDPSSTEEGTCIKERRVVFLKVLIPFKWSDFIQMEL